MPVCLKDYVCRIDVDFTSKRVVLWYKTDSGRMEVVGVITRDDYGNGPRFFFALLCGVID